MKRLAVALLAMVAACGPNYQDGKTKCASDGTCPDGFICGRKAPDLDVCFELSQRPQCTLGQYLCSSGDCVASKDLCSQMGSVNCATGAAVSSNAGSNFLIYWDDDEWRELQNGTSVSKAGGGTLLTCQTPCASNNSTKANATLTADLLGDWREEIVWRESTNATLRVYTTTTVTKRRIHTLMHDPTYRAQVSFEQSAYNQPPHTGFRISPNMNPPPKPDIYVR
jgi:hypothetical protein